MPGMGAIMIYKAHGQVSVIPLLLIKLPHFICVPSVLFILSTILFVKLILELKSQDGIISILSEVVNQKLI